MSSFPLSSESAALLLEYEKTGSITRLAEVMQRDTSVVSRALKKLADELPVLEKINGKWEVTDLGREFISWAQQAILTQQTILNKKIDFKIGTTREFADRFLIQSLYEIYPIDKYNIRIMTFDGNSEKLLLSGQVDLVFDCGKPFDPQVAFERVVDEKISIVASKSFIKKNKILSVDDLQHLSYIHFSRNNLALLSSITKSHLNIASTINDIGVVRSALKSGHGWGLLPNYTIKEELLNKELVAIPGAKLNILKFGVWWNRDKSYLKPHIDKAISWLSKIDLN